MCVSEINDWYIPRIVFQLGVVLFFGCLHDNFALSGLNQRVSLNYLQFMLQVKTKELKEGKERLGNTNGHQFVPVSPSGPALCVACEKSVSGKELLQCSSKCCAAVVALCLWWLNSLGFM